MFKNVANKINYYNFGFIPGKSLRYNIKGKLFGIANILKRLQAKDIMNALDIENGHRVLDFGCGMGFFTIEMAKISKEAIGIDINPYIAEISIPADLKGRLQYIQVTGEKLPFPDNYFDRVLASEILPMIPDPSYFLKEIRRVLKPGGRLVIVNGAGHPAIENAYTKKGWLFQFLKNKYNDRFPNSYAEYEEILQRSFGTSQTRFLKEDDIHSMVSVNGFKNIRFEYSPSYLSGAYFSWSQFILYLRTGRTLSQHMFVFNYYLFSFLRLFEKTKYKSGVICVCEN